ncbi:hypothetical protein L6164_029236 [Bauhinia variegata]|nr:hypothetical protein L6164_029236 [Bauhinia variegata]
MDSSSYSQGKPSPLHSAMDPIEKRAARMSVPQFGGWDQDAAGFTDYSMVFTKARENKKHQKTDISEVRKMSIEKDQEFMNGKYQKSHHHHAHAQPRAQAQAQPREDPALMGRRRVLTYINCCIKP